jgi:hypothetical protein
MIVGGKDICREFIALMVCIFVAVSSGQGTVLCYGADGHVEFESAFHEQCTDHDHSQPGDHGRHSSEAEHDEDENRHHGRCVDISVDIGLIRISQTAEQSDRAFAPVAADAIFAIEQLGCLESGPASNAFFATSYFSPLRTVILLA